MKLDFVCCCVHLHSVAIDQTTLPSNETVPSNETTAPVDETAAPANCQEVWAVTGVAAVLFFTMFILMVVVVVQFTVIWSRR